MARPIWTGTISFGLLNVPVTLHSATRSVDLHFRMLDVRDKTPIRYERVNAETGEEVPWKDIVKAFEYSKGNYVVIDEDEIRAAAPEATETVDIEAFVDAADVDPMYYEKPYYLVPSKRAEKGYVLLRELLKKTGKAGVARVVIRTRQYLALLLPHGDALVLDVLRFPQELVSADELALPAADSSKFKVNAKELEMGRMLLESMTAKWNPDDYQDEFRSKLRDVIESRVAKHQGTVHREEKTKTPAGATTNVVDFMALLKKSLATKKGGDDAGKASKQAASEPKPKRGAAKTAPRRRASGTTRKTSGSGKRRARGA